MAPISGNQSGAGYSNVGSRAVYGNDDQRTTSREYEEELRRSAVNRTAEHRGRTSSTDESELPEDIALSKHDPTAPAMMHGNEPSRGAQVDKELREDDQRRLNEKSQD
ncbi:hypothetical protein KEM55_004919 [Ascosphaera atra]|nr:hypothetical protein KEM55_004919 [Ascosphaera atra]